MLLVVFVDRTSILATDAHALECQSPGGRGELTSEAQDQGSRAGAQGGGQRSHTQGGALTPRDAPCAASEGPREGEPPADTFMEEGIDQEGGQGSGAGAQDGGQETHTQGGALPPCTAAGAACEGPREGGCKMSYRDEVMAFMYEELWPDEHHLDEEFHMSDELRQKGLYTKGTSENTIYDMHKEDQLLMRVKGRRGFSKFVKPRPEHGSPEFIRVFGTNSGISPPSRGARALDADMPSGGRAMQVGGRHAGRRRTQGGVFIRQGDADALCEVPMESGQKMGYTATVLAFMYEELWPDKKHLDKEFYMSDELRKKGLFKQSGSSQTISRIHQSLHLLTKVEGKKGAYKFAKPRPTHGSPEFIKFIGHFKCSNNYLRGAIAAGHGSGSGAQAQEPEQIIADSALQAQEPKQMIADSALHAQDPQQLIADSALQAQKPEQIIADSALKAQEPEQIIDDSALLAIELEQLIADSALQAQDPGHLIADSALLEPEQLIADSALLVHEPEQLIADSALLLQEPEQLIADSALLAQESEQLIADSALQAQEPEQIIADSALQAQEPEQHIADSVLQAQEPEKIIADSALQAQEPEQLIADSALLEPEQLIADSALQAQEPEQHIADSVLQAQEPEKIIADSALQAQEPEQLIADSALLEPKQMIADSALHAQDPQQLIADSALQAQKPEQIIADSALKAQEPEQIIADSALLAIELEQLIADSALSLNKLIADSALLVHEPEQLIADSALLLQEPEQLIADSALLAQEHEQLLRISNCNTGGLKEYADQHARKESESSLLTQHCKTQETEQIIDDSD
eukprot:gene2657-17092_t